ncbi:MAG: hypothetical protein ACRDZ3_20485 [Acidimicrobiia bacterium]
MGTALLQAASDCIRQDGRPLRGKVFAGSPGACFAEARGFGVLQRSRTFRLRPSPDITPPGGFVIDEEAAPDAVAEAFLAFYVRNHAWDPPGDLSVADVRASHVADAVAKWSTATTDRCSPSAASTTIRADCC